MQNEEKIIFSKHTQCHHLSMECCVFFLSFYIKKKEREKNLSDHSIVSLDIRVYSPVKEAYLKLKNNNQ
jgi:hypothetical protein